MQHCAAVMAIYPFSSLSPSAPPFSIELEGIFTDVISFLFNYCSKVVGEKVDERGLEEQDSLKCQMTISHPAKARVEFVFDTVRESGFGDGTGIMACVLEGLETQQRETLRCALEQSSTWSNGPLEFFLILASEALEFAAKLEGQEDWSTPLLARAFEILDESPNVADGIAQ